MKSSQILSLNRIFFDLFEQNYLKENAYGVTNHAELFNFLTEVSQLKLRSSQTRPPQRYNRFQRARADDKSINVSDVMNTWILQMGYPLITAHVGADGLLTLTQKHFLLNPSQNVTRESPFE